MDAALSQLSMHHAELALRMVVGVVLGGLIDWERTVEDRHFGLRIHMLTSLAAAGFSVAALEAVDWARLQNIEADPFASSKLSSPAWPCLQQERSSRATAR